MTVYTAAQSQEKEPSPRVGLWHRYRPGAGDGRTSALFWLAVLVLGLVALVFVTWGASALLAQNGSEKLLRVKLLLPKLKGNHGTRKAAPFRMSEPEPSELAHPKDRKTPPPVVVPPAVIDAPKAAPRVASLEPGLHLIPQVEMTPIASACGEPVVYLNPCSPPPGDSPMMRNWKSLTMYSLLTAAAVTFAPPPAVILAQEKKEPPKTPAVDTDALLKSLQADIKNLETGLLAKIDKKLQGVGDDVQVVKKSVENLKTDLDALQGAQLKQKIELDKQKKEIELLAEEVRSLHKKLLAEGKPATPALDKAILEDMRDALKAIKDGIAKLGAADTSKRFAMSPPNGSNGSAVTSGRVLLQNFYSEDLLFLINGAPFRVPAGKSRLLDGVPLGTLNYLVHSDRFGTLQSRSTVLTANESTFTLTANSPR
ncbi:MAG: hypothetical protein HYX68_20360 [Planctomycetes bacterium]|nr:hypothetical protein [Planctomycetota bacterium]